MTEPEIEITEQDFHLRVVASLARLEIMAKSTDDRLQRFERDRWASRGTATGDPDPMCTAATAVSHSCGRRSPQGGGLE